jgi:hypothetical protein
VCAFDSITENDFSYREVPRVSLSTPTDILPLQVDFEECQFDIAWRRDSALEEDWICREVT